jgi:hypothetical protein
VKRAGVVVAMMVLVGLPATAAAQDYGGGLLPTAAPPTHYLPSLGIVLQPRGSRIAFRFDTSLKCGRDTYDAVGRKVVPFDGRRFRAKAASVFRIGGAGSKNRVIFAWKLRGQADGSTAAGRLTIQGVRIVRGHRTACRHKPVRRWAARLAAPAPAGAPLPPARSSFQGLSDLVIADGLRGPVVLKLGRSGRKVAARWSVAARCGNGGRQQLINYTPPATVHPDGSFGFSERFAVSYADAFIRYRVSFEGRFSGEGATGTLRMRARRFSRDGKRLRSRCDSGTRTWTAAIAQPVAPAAE